MCPLTSSLLVLSLHFADWQKKEVQSCSIVWIHRKRGKNLQSQKWDFKLWHDQQVFQVMQLCSLIMMTSPTFKSFKWDHKSVRVEFGASSTLHGVSDGTARIRGVFRIQFEVSSHPSYPTLQRFTNRGRALTGDLSFLLRFSCVVSWNGDAAALQNVFQKSLPLDAYRQTSAA